eukprot:GHVL01037996.1.p2 GENE.GHVL01037996.1~~GHVL01037996.1.p2  ORF type:complete len:165 (+),score=9.97 GHVL01037996.1:451-945(+)
MMLGDTPHAPRGRIPPLLGQQEGLLQHVERPQSPLVSRETTVVGRRLDAKAHVLRAGPHAVPDVALELLGLRQCQAAQIQLLARRDGKMQRPIEQRQLHGCKRQRVGCAGKRSVKWQVDQICRRRRRHGGGAHGRGIKRLPNVQSIRCQRLRPGVDAPQTTIRV